MAKRNKGVLDAEDKRKLNKENLRKLYGIFRYILPYKWYFFGGLICLLFSSTILLAFPFLSGKLIDVASGQGTWIVDDIKSIVLLLIAVLFIQSVFSFARVMFFAQVSERSIKDLRLALYEKFMNLPIPFYDSRRIGELLSRITSDISLLQDTFSVTLAEFTRQTITLLAGTAFLFYTTPKLTFFMLATFPVLVILALVFGRFIRKLSKKTQDEQAAANVIVEETLQSIQVVKAFTSELFEIARYQKSLTEVVRIALKAATYRAAFISFIIFALFGGIVAVMWYGALLVESGEMTIGSLVSFVLYTTFIGGSIAGLGDLYGQLQKAIGSSERVQEIMEEAVEATADEPKHPIQFEQSITYQHVNFSYATRSDVQVLRDLSFEIKKGEKIALVGHSGAGKSTIIQLLQRFYTVSDGAIAIDGVNINDLSLQGLRREIGVVPQEVVLFGGTIKENIAYGKLGASDEAITQAAQQANAWDFISSFPDGLETIVGERGVKLSGGQRQRIAIARAILKNPSILILDEATSSLDAASESLVQAALDELMKDRTTIIIAHRLATIRKVDRIFVLKEGQIAESGTHQSLLQQGGIYQDLIKLQLQED